jgi:hypothetical protein
MHSPTNSMVKRGARALVHWKDKDIDFIIENILIGQTNPPPRYRASTRRAVTMLGTKLLARFKKCRVNVKGVGFPLALHHPEALITCFATLLVCNVKKGGRALKLVWDTPDTMGMPSENAWAEEILTATDVLEKSPDQFMRLCFVGAVVALHAAAVTDWGYWGTPSGRDLFEARTIQAPAKRNKTVFGESQKKPVDEDNIRVKVIMVHVGDFKHALQVPVPPAALPGEVESVPRQALRDFIDEHLFHNAKFVAVTTECFKYAPIHAKTLNKVVKDISDKVNFKLVGMTKMTPLLMEGVLAGVTVKLTPPIEPNNGGGKAPRAKNGGGKATRAENGYKPTAAQAATNKPQLHLYGRQFCLINYIYTLVLEPFLYPHLRKVPRRWPPSLW